MGLCLINCKPANPQTILAQSDAIPETAQGKETRFVEIFNSQGGNLLPFMTFMVF